jgi:hypothetical protein
MTISESDFNRMQARCQQARGEFPPDPQATSDEKKLHEEILADCKNRLWPVIHSRMDAPSTIGVGVPDFVIFAERAIVIVIECKAGNSKLRPEQLAWKMILERNGHKHFVVRSFAGYLRVVNNLLTTPGTSG